MFKYGIESYKINSLDDINSIEDCFCTSYYNLDINMRNKAKKYFLELGPIEVLIPIPNDFRESIPGYIITKGQRYIYSRERFNYKHGRKLRQVCKDLKLKENL